MSQSLSELQLLLQQKIFGHRSIAQYNSYSQAVFAKMHKCHTAGIGVHYYRCNNSSCNHMHYQYHSCGNRHCPNCGGSKRMQWLQDRMSELLPTSYFHVVFTLPQELRSMVMGNRQALLHLLFEASHYTLTTLGADARWLGATPGIVSILHTHGQDLSFHPHIHCIVSGGGIDTAGHWVTQKRSNGLYLFPKRAMEKIYKAYFLKQLRLLIAQQKVAVLDAHSLAQTLQAVGFKKWNVYAKAPFGGPAQIMEYLGRYTHKVAITAHRIVSITDSDITFHYKDYADGSKRKLMTLSHSEFARRFEQHILPQRFVKIRHAGYMAHNGKTKRIANVLAQLQLPAAMPSVKLPIVMLVMQQTGKDISLCPICNIGKLALIASFINHNGTMVDVAVLQAKRQRNKGSPLIKLQTI